MENQPTDQTTEDSNDDTPTYDIEITLDNLPAGTGTTFYRTIQTTDSIQDWATTLDIEDAKDKKTLRGIRRELRKAATDGKSKTRKWGSLNFILTIEPTQE